jgi:hypothetical protein
MVVFAIVALQDVVGIVSALIPLNQAKQMTTIQPRTILIWSQQQGVGVCAWCGVVVGINGRTITTTNKTTTTAVGHHQAQASS